MLRIVAGNKEASIIGRPMNIETNLPKGNVTLILPLKDVKLSEADRKDLAVYIEHSDGTKQLLKGIIVPFNDKGEMGLQFTVDKFSLFHSSMWRA